MIISTNPATAEDLERFAIWGRASVPPAPPEDPGNRPSDGRGPGAGETSMTEGERKTALEMVQAAGTDRHCVTFVLHEEDHTLGNSLRYMIMKNPEVEFCGYTTTHPSESKINLRIQTRGALPAVEPFQRGLNELMNVCQHVLDKFEASIKDYKDQKASRNGSTF
ncbi:DNA-directed RNA polymerases I and III subunit RPAC2 [Sciurus carolinensis]|uniref:DNA-directed RNA polymerases I and III subunit RPAC2 n=1 Tax=Sciurus carolinensis TaxID=30640 RepID=A0AA41NEV8_SCICA|nr:DNA-directed RNA polymerases I and III subunit RPAC2 [Sciurus carolinensis]